MAEETIWVVPTGDDILLLLDEFSQSATNQNIGEGAPATGELDLSRKNRRDELVRLAAREWRANAQRAGQHPISVLPDSVPPEAVRHVLAIAAWALVGSTPGLERYFHTAEGTEPPLRALYREAREHYERIRRGAAFSRPSNPAGLDYINPVSDDNPEPTGVRWGDYMAGGEDYRREVDEHKRPVSWRTQDMTFY